MSQSEGYDAGQYGTTDRGLGGHSQASSTSEKQKIEKNKFEQLAHLGALGATAIAKYEGEQAKKAEGDPALAERHRKQEKWANSVALGLGGFATQDAQQPGQSHGTQPSSTSTSNPNPNPTSNPTSHPTPNPASNPTSNPTSTSGSPQDYFDKFEEGKKLLNSFFNKK